MPPILRCGWRVQIELDQNKILGLKKFFTKSVCTSLKAALSSFFVFFVFRALIASEFADSASLIEESSERVSCNKSICVH